MPSELPQQSEECYSSSDDSSVEAAAPPQPVVVVVDPYSTGCLVVQEIVTRGYDVVALGPRTFPRK